jgi:hypothetical protein
VPAMVPVRHDPQHSSDFHGRGISLCNSGFAVALAQLCR